MLSWTVAHVRPNRRPARPRLPPGHRGTDAVLGPNSPRSARVALTLLTAAVVLLAGLHGLDKLLELHPFFFDLDREMNLPTWVATAQLAVAAALSFGAARLAEIPASRGWLMLAALLAFVSLDEQVGLHEYLGSQATDSQQPVWILLYLPLGAAGLVAAALVSRDVHATLGVRRPMVVVVACFALAGAAELAGGGMARGSLGWNLELIVEEMSELMAVSVTVSVAIAVIIVKLEAAREQGRHVRV